jgi:trehalose synthase
MNEPHVELVYIAPLPPERYMEVLEPEIAARYREVTGSAREVFAGRAIWNVNSTQYGGGVAEMLHALLAYSRGAGVDARWAVISGTPEFFAITKRLHNNLHNFAGDGGPLRDAERDAYQAALAPSAELLEQMIRPGDPVILHDPQTAGLIPRLKARGISVVWRCHVGIDVPGDNARKAWDFLRPYVGEADVCVFSRESFVWEGLDPSRIALIAPVIDAFSPKNVELPRQNVVAILRAARVIEADSNGQPVYTMYDGSPGRVERQATVYEEASPRADDELVVQVSRWDALKDPLGVIEGFARFIAPASDAHLVYAGPAVEAVSDDPEGSTTLDHAVDLWRSLPPKQRRRIHLACLPMADAQENAATVNALQRHATVVVQKSLAEGFGLTVAEAMWKGRPVVASRIGGIQDQIEDGVTGVLIDDPGDLEAYGRSVLALLRDGRRAAEMGRAAQARVRDQFLGARSLMQYMQLLGKLIS